MSRGHLTLLPLFMRAGASRSRNRRAIPPVAAVMSSGWTIDADRQFFYTTEASRIPTCNKQLKPFWWGWGATDITRSNSLLVTDRFKKDGVHLETMETADGHEWKNWRLYLHEVAPRLFQQK